MSGRKAAVGLCLFCSLVFCAIAAQSASAAGTTAFTCKKVTPAIGTAGFSDAHCKSAVSSNAEYEHVEIKENTTTEITGTSDRTAACEPWTLKSVNSGVELELKSNCVHITSGTLHNVKVGEEHVATGTAKLTYTEVSVVKPAGKGCKVFTDTEKVKGAEAMVNTEELTTTTAGQEMAAKSEPPAGKPFASFFVEGCSIGALNHTYEVTGSIKTTSINGATWEYTEAQTTEQGTLKLSGQKAGIEGVLTIKGKHPVLDTEYTPISATTT